MKKYIDINGLRKCTKCMKVYPLTADYFHRVHEKLTVSCKFCNNEYRNSAEKAKKYHNIPCRCPVCDSFFWASKADINKNKSRTGREEVYCSRKCLSKIYPFARPGNTGYCWGGRRGGENNPNAKYSSNDVYKAKKLIKEGKKYKEISQETGMPVKYLYTLKSRKVWSSVEV